MPDPVFVACDDEQPGFVTTEAAYREFVQAGRLRPLVATQLRRLREGADLVAVGAYIRTAYFEAEMPVAIAAAIEQACAGLGETDAELVVGGVVTDDLIDEFLTGPHEIFVGVKGRRALLAAVKRCWGSVFSDRAIIYREVRDIDHLDVALAVRIEPLSAGRASDAELQGTAAV